jgi:hypothetical protein
MFRNGNATYFLFWGVLEALGPILGVSGPPVLGVRGGCFGGPFRSGLGAGLWALEGRFGAVFEGM